MSRRPRVLLVDDASPVLNVLRDTLALAGFEVATAPTATDALELLNNRQYAVIAAESFLPDLSALDWLAALRGAAPGTPLILYAGSSRLEELRTHARGFGAFAVLEKPFSPAQLVEAVRVALKGAR